MTPEQAAAYVIAQSVCALAEIVAMQARDRAWIGAGLCPHTDLDYLAVVKRYCVSHNAVLQCFQDANR